MTTIRFWNKIIYTYLVGVNHHLKVHYHLRQQLRYSTPNKNYLILSIDEKGNKMIQYLFKTY